MESRGTFRRSCSPNIVVFVVAPSGARAISVRGDARRDPTSPLPRLVGFRFQTRVCCALLMQTASSQDRSTICAAIWRHCSHCTDVNSRGTRSVFHSQLFCVLTRVVAHFMIHPSSVSGEEGPDRGGAGQNGAVLRGDAAYARRGEYDTQSFSTSLTQNDGCLLRASLSAQNRIVPRQEHTNNVWCRFRNRVEMDVEFIVRGTCIQFAAQHVRKKLPSGPTLLCSHTESLENQRNPVH